MKKWTVLMAMGLGALGATSGNAAAPAPEVIPLYDGVAPGSETWTQKEGSFDLEDKRFTPANPDTLVWNVTRPVLTVFRPASGKSNGAAVIIAPGGGFRVLSYKNEGLRVAQYMTSKGFTAFVLKYRLNRMPDDPAEIIRGMDQMAAGPPPGMPAGARPGTPGFDPMKAMPIGPAELAAFADGQRAVQLVRSRAKTYGVDPKRVGIMGFSAGAVVAGEAALAKQDRPDWVGIIYGGVRSEVTADAPPAFMAAAADDPLSVALPALFTRWVGAGAKAELHIYGKGQHGFGTARQGLPVDGWLDVYYGWLGQQGFLKTH
jgi:acetyl esterase/lipase